MSIKRLPLFVYGTLVPKHGFCNFTNVLDGKVTLFPPGIPGDQTGYTVARVNKWNIYHLSGFPGALPCPKEGEECGSGVVGALVWPNGIHDTTTDEYSKLILEADRLEKYNQGYPDEYRRIEVIAVISSTGETVSAWIYECLLDVSSAHRVEDGNWPKYMKEHDLKDSGDDWSSKFHSSE